MWGPTGSFPGGLRTGLEAKPPASFPYLKLVIEQIGGAPEQPVSVTTKVVHELHPNGDPMDKGDPHGRSGAVQRPHTSVPYLRLVIEHLAGQSEQAFTGVTKIVHELREADSAGPGRDSPAALIERG